MGLRSAGLIDRTGGGQRRVPDGVNRPTAAAVHGRGGIIQLAVEVLESKSDPRYKHFQTKIQNLVKKKILVEEMERNAARKIEPEMLLEARRAELGEKKQDHNLQMYLNAEQVNRKKVKELVERAEHQGNKLKTQVEGTINNQDKNLQDRIQRRKMRSEAGSLEKFKVNKGHVTEKNIAGQKLDAFFLPFEPL